MFAGATWNVLPSTVEAPLAMLQGKGFAGGQGVSEERADRVQIVRMNDRVQHAG